VAGHKHNRLHFRLLVAFSAAACLSTFASTSAQTVTWTGGGTSNWSDGANWSPAGQPSSGSSLSFGGVTQITSTNNIVGLGVSGLAFTNDGTPGKTGAFTLSGSTLTLDGNITTTASSSALTDTLGMPIALSGNRQITTNTNHSLTISGAISGTGNGLTKEGAGTLTLSATNTFTGTLTVNAGSLFMTNGSVDNTWSTTVVNTGTTLRTFGRDSLGEDDSTTTVNAATLDLRNFNAARDRNIVFNGTNQLTLALSSTGTYSIKSMAMPSSGTLTITSQVNSGTATMTHTLSTPMVLNGSGSLILEPVNSSGSTTTLELTGGITDTGANLVRKTSTGVLLLTSDIRNRGETRLSNGFTRLGKNEALASGAGFGNLTMNPTNSALLQLNGFNQTLNGISNSGSGRSILANDSNTNGTLTLGANNANGTFTGEIRDVSNFSGTFTGTLSLAKTGAGTLTLGTGTYLYTGTTSVNAGTLAVLGNLTNSTGSVSIADGATLAGTGTVGGATTVGGSVAPGTTTPGTIGTLSFANGLTWQGAAAAGSTTDWSFTLGATAGSADLVNITGDFLKNTTAGSTFRFDFGNTGLAEGTYPLAQWTGSTTFTAADFSYVNLANDGASFTIDGSTLNLSVVPEPASVTLLTILVGASLVGFARRRGA
jgi:fibronectin-binding autotransporter adhesin